VQFIIDRFEEDFVVCQNTHTQEIIHLDKNLFPEYAKEGDLIDYNDSVVKVLDNTACRARIRERMSRLWKK